MNSDAVLAAVMHSSLDGIIVIDEGGRVVEFNPAAEAMFGHSRAEVLGRPVGDVIVPPAVRGAHAAGFSRYLAGGDPRVLGRRLEVEAMHADGSVFPVELAITEAAGADGRLFTACMRDLTERRAQEAALRESEGRLKSFLENAPVGMFIRRLAGEYTVLNATMLNGMGTTAERALGRPYGEVAGEAVVAETLATERIILETGRPHVTEVVYPTATGPRETLAVRFPLRDAAGEITHIGGVLVDIADQKRVEARLRETEERLTSFMNHAPIGMYVTALDGRYEMVNAPILDSLGIGPDQAVGRPYWDVLGAEYRDEGEATKQRVLDSGQPQVNEVAFPSLRGMRDTMIVRFPLRDASGRIAQIGGVVIDVTDQKQTERRLRESERRFRTLSDLHPVPVVFVRVRDRRVLLANPAFNEMMLAPSIDLETLNRTLWFVSVDERERVAELLQRQERTDGLEAEMRRPDGSAFWAAISARRVELDGETVLVVSFVDLTDRKRAEADLERSREALFQSEKLTALGSMLAGVSHELNNPLAVVVGQSIILEEDAAGGPLAEPAGIIRRAAERCSRIVQTFLAMARQKAPERRAVSAAAVLDGALELAAYGLRTAGVRVDRDYQLDLPPLWADADQLHQVVMNLLVNAQQALGEVTGDRRLRVRTGAAGPGRVAIEVGDNGPGIPPDVARRIFEPFYTTKPLGAGTGVGLSFSRGVVEAHGGTLSLVQRDAGATFRVELPAAQAATANEDTPSASAGVAEPTARPRVLIVDDEPELALTLARFVEREGFVAEVADGGLTAQRLLRATAYDAILSDVRMPDLDGPGLFAWLAAERPELVDRLAFVTGDTLGPAASRFLDEAARPRLEKPFTRDGVRRLLAEVAAGAGSRR